MSAYSVIVTATGVLIMGSSGTQTTLALPNGVVGTGRRARAAILNKRLIIVNAFTAPIWLSPDLILRPLAMPTPNTKPTLAAGAAGSYTGARRAKVSFLLKDATTGRIQGEGPLSEQSASVAFAAQKIVISTLATPAVGAPVTGRRIYLTTAGGSVFFAAFDIDDITTTSVTTSVADAALSTIAAPDDLVAAPTNLDLIVTWKNRLWARSALDRVHGTTSGIADRWPNSFAVEPQGADGFGVTGFLPRKADLGILRRDRLWKLVGDDEDTFELVKVIDGKGGVAPDACKVIRDVGYFLSDDGVFTWAVDGVESITDDTVRPWFTTDTYFNRGLFNSAFAEYDPTRHRYLLFLAAAGSTVINRWVEFDIATKTWFGPHKCDAVTNWNAAAIAPDGSDVLRLVLAANDGYCYAFTPSSSTDGASTAIAFDVIGKAHSGGNPDSFHVWLEPSIFSKTEAGGTLIVTPYLDTLDAAAGATLSHALTGERGRLDRIGVGRLCKLQFTLATAGRGVTIYGYQIPFVPTGRR